MESACGGYLGAVLLNRRLEIADKGADGVRALVGGAPKRLRVCTSCIQAGKVLKEVISK